MARFLDVYLNTDLVGQLEQDNSGTLRFRYDASWLGSTKAFPLSVSLPFQDASFNRRECRPFFAGLLPEETHSAKAETHKESALRSITMPRPGPREPAGD